jgi:hypothetical protein
VEIRLFFAFYFITLPLQLISTGSLLTQGSTPLVAISAIHAGAVTALFWALLGNAIVALQVVEDGSLSSIIVSFVFFERLPLNKAFSLALFRHFPSFLCRYHVYRI